ncbi:MAG TPA: peptidylprolyl isomerase [Sphingomicrobium sp.]|nr:peptidylprolyl isomerase [Sphingomicrobium sp.]
MARAFRLNSTRALCLGAAVLLGVASGAAAQVSADQASQPVNSSQSLHLPENPELFATVMPPIIKATAIVNGDVITQTDVDQRLAFLSIASGQPIPADQIDTLRQQVLSNLIDETLEIQAAKAEKIDIKKADIDRTVARVAKDSKQTPEQMAAYLGSHGSSIESLRRQIQGEIAWARLQQAKIEDGVSVGDDEVKAVLDRLNASKGTEQYRVSEIFLSATPYTQTETIQNADKILDQLKNGASFPAFARQYSQASTAAVGGDLGWVRPEQLPTQIADVLRQMTPGTISNPISLPGGVSIIAVQDTRKILTPDPRDAVLSLKQISLKFPKGTTRQQAEPVVEQFVAATRNIGGCGGAEKIASDFHAEVVQSDDIKTRDLPGAMQELVMPLQIGQATVPFGSIEDSVRVLVVCGRDQPDPTAPTFDDVYNQINQERVNMRSRRYLADLRRDAVIEYR